MNDRFTKTIARLHAFFSEQPLPGLEKCMEMAPENRRHMRVAAAREKGCREGAVLILLYPFNNDIYTILTVRSADLRTHAGQISLPGGRIEAGETPADAALRETFEELAVPPAALQVVGQLTEVYIPPSNYCLAPVVAVSATRPDFVPHPGEVAALIELPARHFVGIANRFAGQRVIEGEPRTIPYFQFNEHQIWGATAIVMSEFAAVWEQVMD